MPPTGFETVTAALDALDTATNDAADRVQKIIDDINKTKGEGLSGPQVENVLARLGAEVEQLKGLAADTTNPIPTPPGGAAPMPGPFS